MTLILKHKIKSTLLWRCQQKTSWQNGCLGLSYYSASARVFLCRFTFPRLDVHYTWHIYTVITSQMFIWTGLKVPRDLRAVFISCPRKMYLVTKYPSNKCIKVKYKILVAENTFVTLDTWNLYKMAEHSDFHNKSLDPTRRKTTTLNASVTKQNCKNNNNKNTENSLLPFVETCSLSNSKTWLLTPNNYNL